MCAVHLIAGACRAACCLVASSDKTHSLVSGQDVTPLLSSMPSIASSIQIHERRRRRRALSRLGGPRLGRRADPAPPAGLAARGEAGAAPAALRRAVGGRGPGRARRAGRGRVDQTANGRTACGAGSVARPGCAARRTVSRLSTYNLKPLACAVCPPSTTAGQLLDAHTETYYGDAVFVPGNFVVHTGDGDRGWSADGRAIGYGGLQLCALNGRKLVSPAGSPRSSGYRLSGAAPEALVFIVGYTF